MLGRFRRGDYPESESRRLATGMRISAAQDAFVRITDLPIGGVHRPRKACHPERDGRGLRIMSIAVQAADGRFRHCRRYNAATAFDGPPPILFAERLWRGPRGDMCRTRAQSPPGRSLQRL